MAANPSNTLQGTASTLCTDRRRRRRVARERASTSLNGQIPLFPLPPSSLPSRPPLLPSLQSCPLHRGCMLYTAISMSFLDGDDSIGRLYCTLPPHSKPASLSLCGDTGIDQRHFFSFCSFTEMDLARTRERAREESSRVERAAAVSSRKYWTGNNCGQRCTDISERGRGG